MGLIANINAFLIYENENMRRRYMWLTSSSSTQDYIGDSKETKLTKTLSFELIISADLLNL